MRVEGNESVGKRNLSSHATGCFSPEDDERFTPTSTDGLHPGEGSDCVQKDSLILFPKIFLRSKRIGTVLLVIIERSENAARLEQSIKISILLFLLIKLEK